MSICPQEKKKKKRGEKSVVTVCRCICRSSLFCLRRLEIKFKKNHLHSVRLSHQPEHNIRNIRRKSIYKKCNIIQIYSGITGGRMLDEELLYRNHHETVCRQMQTNSRIFVYEKNVGESVAINLG